MTLIINGACIPENHHVYQKLYKTGNVLNAEYSEDRTENGVPDSKWCNESGKWTNKTPGMCNSSYHGHTEEIDVSHNIELEL